MPCVNTNVTGVRAVAGVIGAPMATVVPSEERETLHAAPITRRFAVMRGCNAD